jgi:hypothetical protein
LLSVTLSSSGGISKPFCIPQIAIDLLWLKINVLSLEITMESKFNSYILHDINTIDFMTAEAEKRLEKQTAFLIASDVRSLGILSASVAVATAAVALMTFNFGQKSVSLPMLFATLAILYHAVRGITLSHLALLTVEHKPIGWPPSVLLEDLYKRKSLETIKIEIIAHLDQRLEDNRVTKRELDSYSNEALSHLADAPVSAIIMFLLATVSLHLASLS